MAQRWYQKAGVQTALVSGIVLLTVTTINQCSESNRLRTDNDRLHTENQRCETQLAPFRALALTQYPGNEADALKKLAEDFDRKLARAAAKVTSYRARVSIRVTANWVSGQPPNASVMPLTGGVDALMLYPIVGGNDSLEVKLNLVGGSVRLTPEGKATVISYETEAPAGSWVLGSDIRDVTGYSRLRVKLFGINATSTVDRMASETTIAVDVFVNGEQHLTINEHHDQPIPLPEKGTPIANIGASSPWKPALHS